MAEVSKEDLQRIHDKLDPIGNAVAVIESQLKTHLAEHKALRQSWQRSIIGGVIHLIEICAIAGVAFFFGRN